MAHQKTNTPSSLQQSKVTSRIEPAQSQLQPMEQVGPTAEQIAERAYQIFLNRGAEHGHDQEDWFQAEKELRLGQQ